MRCKVNAVLLLAALTALPCTVENSLTAYERPGLSAEVFGTISPGEVVEVLVITGSGWLGFDPGTAQAGNSGSFRYRWLQPNSIPVTDSLEVVWAPGPGVTYIMTMEDTPVYAEADTASSVLITLPAGSGAEMAGVNMDWVRVDLWDSSVEEDIQGWVIADIISIKW